MLIGEEIGEAGDGSGVIELAEATVELIVPSGVLKDDSWSDMRVSKASDGSGGFSSSH